LPADGFNIDHVVLSTHGIFAVETKGYTKRNGIASGRREATVVFDGASLAFPASTTTEPLEQAERQAQWLAKFLGRSTGEALMVSPVLALPGWFVVRKGRGKVSVFSGRELTTLLRAGRANQWSPAQVERAAYQIERRCRDVKASYRDEDSRPQAR
jgi:hypothetical protein